MNAEIDDIKARLKKFNARATQAKMDLHDLSEELPTRWEMIPQVAQRCFEAHAMLMDARKALATAEAEVPRKKEIQA